MKKLIHKTPHNKDYYRHFGSKESRGGLEVSTNSPQVKMSKHHTNLRYPKAKSNALKKLTSGDKMSKSLNHYLKHGSIKDK